MKPGAKKGVTRPRRSRLFCMMSPISIVLCTYNGERYLDEQLRSLRAQEGVAEIVVVDDGSTDGTRALLRAHASADTRVRVHHNGVRTGVSGNFERGIGLARCEWVALSDQDDIWLPWKLARLRRAWNGQACLIHHASHKFRGREPDSLPFSARQDRKFRGGAPHQLFFRNSVVGHTILMRREVALRLMPFPRDSLHDWWLGVGASSMGTVQYVDEYLVHYRIHESNAYCACGSRARRRMEALDARIRFLASVEDRPWLTPELVAFAQAYRAELEDARDKVFSWRLWRFYWRHAEAFFDGSRACTAVLGNLRRSLQAACNLSNLGARRAPAPAPWMRRDAARAS